MRLQKSENATERLVLTGMIVDSIVCGRIATKWQNNLFRSKWANLVGAWCVQYHSKYGKAPAKHIEALYRSWSEKTKDKEAVSLVEKFLSSLSDEYKHLKRESNSEYILDKAGNLFSEIRVERLRDDIENDLSTKDVDKAMERILSFDQVKIGAGEDINVFRAKEQWMEAFAEEPEGIVKYPGGMGQFFGNQFGRDMFVGFMGPEGRGKSHCLMDVAFRAALQRRRVAFFEAGDMSQNQIMRRLATRITNRPIRESLVEYPLAIRKLKKDEKLVVDTKQIFYKGNLDWRDVVRQCKRLRREKIRSQEPYFRLLCYPNSTLHTKTIESTLTGWAREGWVVDVVCIAEGSKVLTDKGLIPIEKVTKEHKLWDGLNWVTHDGPICKGEKEVIEYAGITATPEHEIWTEKGWRTLESCKQLGLRIAQTEIKGEAIRIGSYYIGDNSSTDIQSQKQAIQWLRNSKKRIRPCAMQSLQRREMDILGKSISWNSQRLSDMLTTKKISNMALFENEVETTCMSESKKYPLEGLWRKRNQISLPIYNRSLSMDRFKFRNSRGQETPNRSNRQRWTLRTWKHSLVNAYTKLLPYTQTTYRSNDAQIQDIISICEIQRQNIKGLSYKGNDRRTNHKTMGQIPSVSRRKKTKVWDILNAGPLHRFTVQGVLVHNCIDYADIMDMSYGKLEGRDRIDRLWRELRKISQKFHCLVVTATQTNRESYDAKIISRKHSSEDKRKLAHVTGMLGINQTDDEKEQEIMRFNWIKIRDAPYHEKKCVAVAGCLAVGNIAIRSIL